MGQPCSACEKADKEAATTVNSRPGSKEAVAKVAGAKGTSSKATDVAKAMTGVSKQELKDLFNRIDRDQSGVVSIDEWTRGIFNNKELLQKLFGESSPKEMKKVFQRIDANYSDTITWDEFYAAAKSFVVAEKTASVMSTAAGQKKWKEFFAVMDKDSSGKVSVEEWSRAIMDDPSIWKLLDDSGETYSLADIKTAFERLDKDKSGELDWDEFVASTASYKVVNDMADAMETDEGKKEMTVMFECLDKNDDGKVTAEEWADAIVKDRKLMAKLVSDADTVRVDDVARAFKRIDTDGSGALSFAEFEARLSRGA